MIKDTIPETKVHSPEYNLGYAASINVGFKETPPPWIILANDVIIGISAIEHMIKTHRAQPDLRIVGSSKGLVCALVTEQAIEEIGYFDENFYPAYCEDCDWWRRLTLAKVKTGNAPGALVRHLGSQTIRSDPKLEKMNIQTHQRNISYYRRKWGGPPGQELYERPFGNPNCPLQHWELDESHYAKNWNIWNA